MSKKSPSRKPRKIDWDKVCEANRQQCNKHTDEERRHFVNEALRIIYSSDAEAPVRRR
ncbi:MAG: hypothetical protein HY301_12050 [Verrucomicrobia bacterium]|nr:hypothetical protein [Verrucomicrobiota bacterium]